MNFKKFITSLLPGIFLFGFTVGTGSVTSMAKAGADYGMSLLWTILLSCYITYFMINQYGRFTLITGQTALAAFKKHIHPVVGIFFIVSLTMHVSGSIIGVMGIIADIVHVWTMTIIDGGIPHVAIALFFVILVYLLFLNGQTKVFQKVLSFIVGIMAICFLINFLLMPPSGGEIVKGLIPKVPETGSAEKAFLVIASMVGTTVFSGLFILRGTLVKEANWTWSDYKIQKRDAMFAGIMMFIVSASIMAAASGTLHVKGISLENVSEMIVLLKPIAGPFAVAIFTLGVVAAGVSSQFPNISMLPWLMDDYKGRKPNLRRLDYRIYVLLLSLLGMVVPVFRSKPVTVMIASQAFSALILPVTVACLIYLGNKKKIVGEKKLSVASNIQLSLIMIFSLIMGYMSYTGLFTFIKNL
ncbi:MAG TPA: Nramp family divalent metal transporter [Draconibacterium sp.]|nr:Nramp family divalent metal transporter [Draconibacterium sp.]